MTTLSLTRFAAAGGLALSLTVGAGVAVAAPDLSPIVNTTCNYTQLMSALDEQDPAAAAEFKSDPDAPGMLRMFLASSPASRQQMVGLIQAKPEAQRYLPTIIGVVNSCHSY